IFYNGSDGLTPHPLLIGGEFESNTPQWGMQGLADEVSIYGRALTQTEIFNIVRQGSYGKCGGASQCTPSPNNQVAWFKGENNANDSAGTNNGTAQNGATYAAGRIGQAMSFDGVDDYFSVPNSSALDITGDLTIEGWIYPTSSDRGRIVSKQTLAGGLVNYVLEINNGKIYFLGTDGNAALYVFASPQSVPLNQWSHVAFTMNASNVSFVVNGIAESISGTNLGARPVTDGPVYIGASRYNGTPNGHTFFSGRIDELSLYNRILTTAELQEIYNAGGAGKCPTPQCVNAPNNQIAWFRGENNANDSQGSNNGTLQNGATFAAGRVGQGIKFDGVNDAVVIPDAAALKPANVTVESWVKFDALASNTSGGAPSGTQFLAFKKNTRTTQFEGYSLVKSSGNKFVFAVSSSGGTQVEAVSSTIATTGVFYHVVGTYDGTASRIYVNGQLEATTNGAITLDYNTLPVYLGTSGEAYDGKFNGVLDETSIYSRSLTATEIQSIYNAGSTGKCPPAQCVNAPTNQVSWYRGENNVGDSQGTNNGTNNGATFTTGKVGQAFTFDGNDYVETPIINLGSNYSLEFWINPTANSTPRN
ncbi:MAG TPA: LamG domain-containing protein, partial [Pyrinomonadaceae bacterium]|nr:LamG domain-containing protein [Pyrinomonadaceae bacterium]